MLLRKTKLHAIADFISKALIVTNFVQSVICAEKQMR